MENPEALLQAQLKPWYASIAEPAAAQEKVLRKLLQIYAQTRYGRERLAAQLGSCSEFRKAFPVLGYPEYQPMIRRVMEGDHELLLSEPPIGWAITRGTTEGESKFIPMTPTDLEMRVSAGRAVLNYAADTKQYDLFAGVNLNLNFPSTVGHINVAGRDISYGYSSGIYTRFVSEKTPVRSVPSQKEIDELGGGKTKQDWNARFELAYQKCREENVTLVGGVAPTALKFGTYMHETHGLYPKDLWKTKIMTLGSIPGINTRYAPSLRAMYGNVSIREIYGTTEGMFGQQKDTIRAWVPNYDLFFFEIETGSGIKMLHEMKTWETGSLIISTPILPRYKIGDLIMAYRSPYFRCIGRDRWWTPYYHFWKELSTFNLNRL